MIDYAMSMETYRAHPAVSASDLKNLQRSAAYARLRPSKSSEAKDWGTAVHTAILEPHLLDEHYGIDPQDPTRGGYPKGWRNRDEYKTRRDVMLKSFKGLLEPEQWDGLKAIEAAVKSHQIGKMLHAKDGHREASVFVTDETTGLQIKCRPDWLIPDAKMVVDIKTARDHRARPFSYACRDYAYHLSAALYLDAISQVMPIEHYVFLVINAEPPYEIAAYTLDGDSIEQGRSDYRRGLLEWAFCTKENSWAGGSPQIEEIRLPDSAITYYQNEGDSPWQ